MPRKTKRQLAALRGWATRRKNQRKSERLLRRDLQKPQRPRGEKRQFSRVSHKRSAPAKSKGDKHEKERRRRSTRSRRRNYGINSKKQKILRPRSGKHFVSVSRKSSKRTSRLEFKKRSAAAKKGWVTRRKNEKRKKKQREITPPPTPERTNSEWIVTVIETGKKKNKPRTSEDLFVVYWTDTTEQQLLEFTVEWIEKNGNGYPKEITNVIRYNATPPIIARGPLTSRPQEVKLR
jgi:hypothetical protein